MNRGPDLYPLRFEEIIQHYDFGNRKIAQLFPEKDLPEEGIIAETWEASAHPNFPGRVINGPLSGRTLPELVDSYGPGILGKSVDEKYGSLFPLLLKFLDARETLEVQVHPDDDYARSQGLDKLGKPEAWYILEAEPGAELFWRTKRGVTKETLRQVGPDEEKFFDHLMKVPVQQSDVIYLPPGTVHAIGKGIVMCEIQLTSDVTIGPDYLFCSGTKLESVRPEEAFEMFMDQIILKDVYESEAKIPPASFFEGGNQFTYLLATPYFALEKLELNQELNFCDSHYGVTDKFLIITELAGSTEILVKDWEVGLSPGHTALLPAAVKEARIRPGQRRAEILISYVPDLRKDVIAPLTSRGFSENQIVSLGGPGEDRGLSEMLS